MPVAGGIGTPPESPAHDRDARLASPVKIANREIRLGGPVACRNGSVQFATIRYETRRHPDSADLVGKS